MPREAGQRAHRLPGRMARGGRRRRTRRQPNPTAASKAADPGQADHRAAASMEGTHNSGRADGRRPPFPAIPHSAEPTGSPAPWPPPMRPDDDGGPDPPRGSAGPQSTSEPAFLGASGLWQLRFPREASSPHAEYARLPRTRGRHTGRSGSSSSGPTAADQKPATARLQPIRELVWRIDALENPGARSECIGGRHGMLYEACWRAGPGTRIQRWLRRRRAARRWMPTAGQEWALLRLASGFNEAFHVLRLLAGGLGCGGRARDRHSGPVPPDLRGVRKLSARTRLAHGQ